MPETLREKASKKLRGPDANPSQLGDPISLKAETSDNIPTSGDEGAQLASSSPVYSSSSSSNSQSTTNEGGSKKTGDGEGESLREKASKNANGPDVNPTQLGNPTSLRSEASSGLPVEREQGVREEEAFVKNSKL
jgi:hypothetical protein